MRSAFVPSWSAMRIPVLGIISERDIARAVAERGAAALNEPVSQHMTAKVITCTRSCSVRDLMELMTDRRIRHVPVVEDGRLNGVVSIGDVVKHRLSVERADDQTPNRATHGSFQPAPNTVIASPRPSSL